MPKGIGYGKDKKKIPKKLKKPAKIKKIKMPKKKRIQSSIRKAKPGYSKKKSRRI